MEVKRGGAGRIGFVWVFINPVYFCFLQSLSCALNFCCGMLDDAGTSYETVDHPARLLVNAPVSHPMDHPEDYSVRDPVGHPAERRWNHSLNHLSSAQHLH
jgi:hypothetical protein